MIFCYQYNLLVYFQLDFMKKLLKLLCVILKIGLRVDPGVRLVCTKFNFVFI